MMTKIYGTELLEDSLPNISLRWINAIILDKELSEESYERSNCGGWHSPDNLQDDLRFAGIIRDIGDILDSRLRKEVGYRNDVLFSINNMWANVNRKGNFNTVHLHPNSDWSFCFYTNVPENSGNLIFRDTRVGKDMVCDNWAKKAKDERNVFIVPQDGQLVIFPSYLNHQVQPNSGEEPRISISGNVSLVEGGQHV